MKHERWGCTCRVICYYEWQEHQQESIYYSVDEGPGEVGDVVAPHQGLPMYLQQIDRWIDRDGQTEGEMDKNEKKEKRTINK